MATPFDPYYKWLGIPPAEQPPNHYRLLGISLFESNADAIESAADQRMVHLRSFQTGEHARESQRLLNAVSAAKLCLLQRQKKSQYDAQLRAKLGQNGAANVAATMVAQASSTLLQAAALHEPSETTPPSAAVTDWQNAAADFSAPSGRVRTSRVRKKSSAPAALIGGVAIGVLALAAIGFALSHLNDATTDTSSDNQTAAQPAPLTPPTPAHRHDDKRSGSLAGAPASRPGDLRVASLTNKPPPVPKGSSSGASQHSPIAPVTSPQSSSDHSIGEPDAVTGDEGISAADLARRRRFLVPPDGTKPSASNGDASGDTSSDMNKSATVPGDGNSTGEAAEPRVAAPDEAAQQKSLQQLKDVLKDDFAAAKSPDGQLALAKKLEKLATDTKNDSAGRYVMFSQSLELAVKCSDVALTASILDSLAKLYEFDVWDQRQKSFTQLSRNAKTADDRAAVAKAALDLAGQALADEHPAAASALAATTSNLATALKDTALRDQARELTDSARRFEKEQVVYDEALKRLKKSPYDPEANLIVGRVKCFLLGDWTGGAPLLAVSGDESLKALGKQEAANPTDADQQAKLADGWWDQAEKLEKKAERKDDPAAKAMHDRAIYWYRLAEPNLSGLVAEKAHKRIEAEDAKKPEGPITETAYLDDMPEQNVTLANASLGKHGDSGLVRQQRGVGAFGGGKRGAGLTQSPDVPSSVAVNGQEAKHALSMLPRFNGEASVSYQLDGKYRVFNGVVAVMDGASLPCAVKFGVFADGKPIWASPVLTRSGEFQKFSLRIAKVQSIQLKIICQGSNVGALTAWINPAVGK